MPREQQQPCEFTCCFIESLMPFAVTQSQAWSYAGYENQQLTKRKRKILSNLFPFALKRMQMCPFTRALEIITLHVAVALFHFGFLLSTWRPGNQTKFPFKWQQLLTDRFLRNVLWTPAQFSWSYLIPNWTSCLSHRGRRQLIWWQSVVVASIYTFHLRLLKGLSVPSVTKLSSSIFFFLFTWVTRSFDDILSICAYECLL